MNVSLGQPGSTTGAQLVERDAGDECQGTAQVLHAVSASGLAACPQPAEQVAVEENTTDLIDAHPTLPGRRGLLGSGKVFLSGHGIGAQPFPQRIDVTPDGAVGDVEDLPQLGRSHASRACHEVDQ